MFFLGGDLTTFPNLPPTKEIKAKISTTLRTVVAPVIKRDLRTLNAAWTTIKESGPTALKEKTPDLLWPLWTETDNQQTQGRICLLFLLLFNYPSKVLLDSKLNKANGL